MRCWEGRAPGAGSSSTPFSLACRLLVGLRSPRTSGSSRVLCAFGGCTGSLGQLRKSYSMYIAVHFSTPRVESQIVISIFLDTALTGDGRYELPHPLIRFIQTSPTYRLSDTSRLRRVAPSAPLTQRTPCSRLEFRLAAGLTALLSPPRSRPSPGATAFPPSASSSKTHSLPFSAQYKQCQTKK